MPKIGILATDKCMASSISGLLDIFSAANYCISRQYKGEDRDFFQAKILSENGHSVVAYNGQSIHVHASFEELDNIDLIVVAPVMPAVFTENESINHLIGLKAYVAAVEKYYKKGTTIASVCTGTHILAKAGLLNGKDATTHWKSVEVFKRLYPQINLTQSKILISSDSIIMAGGAASYFDLGVELVRRFSTHEVASSCTNLLVFNREEDSQKSYEEFDNYTEHGDFKIKKIQEWIEDNFERNFTLEEVSGVFGMGSRNLQRRFRTATGYSPNQFIQKIRVSAAKNLLVVTNESLHEITERVGYSDYSSFSRLFKKHCDMTMSEYRQKFSSKVVQEFKVAS